jgi:hypothetical protein
MRRNVSWSTSIRVVLIPQKEEFVDNKIHDSIWWSESEMTSMKNNAIEEVQGIMRDFGVDSKKAIELIMARS